MQPLPCGSAMEKNSYSTVPFSCLTLSERQRFLLRPTGHQTAEIVARITDVVYLFPRKIDSLVKIKNPVIFGLHWIRYRFLHIPIPRYVPFSTRTLYLPGLCSGTHPAGEYDSTRMNRPQSLIFVVKHTLNRERPPTVYGTPEGTQ